MLRSSDQIRGTAICTPRFVVQIHAALWATICTYLDIQPPTGIVPPPFRKVPRTMAKPSTVKIKLVSTADTGFYYVTQKNPRNLTEKMVMKKYDPVVRKHVDFKEAKIK